MQKPIIFLDFDGVLNNDETETLVTYHVGLDEVLVAKLNEIMDHVDSHVVVSSTWRIRYDFNELKDLLVSAGFKHVESIVDTTMLDHDYSEYDFDRMHYVSSRSFEIERYLKENCDDGQRFVILDDDKTVFKDNHVLTLESIGLTDDDVKNAIEILQRGKEWSKKK